MFAYDFSLVRAVPDCFANCLTQESPHEPINVEVAKAQHLKYEEELRKVIPKVVEVPVDNSLADCCFVEDTAVFADGRLVLTNMVAPSRLPEVAATGDVMTRLGVPFDDMRTEPAAHVDGGDVLTTGLGEMLVGMSNRTNAAGAAFLANSFPGRRVVPIAVQKAFNLKSIVSLLAEDCIVVADTPPGHDVVEQIRRQHQGPGYQFVFVPDSVAANVLRVGDSVFIQAGYPASESILESAAASHGLTVVKLCMSELIKADGALTCCSVPFMCRR
eukprot:TRINITY_DN24114_c0_g1_i1.p1 TRINITY_DN24114_c0_g1~~TRINITY_DN24114_c0_g1_i1.p1  ORF type:complete len:273 (+),score=91.82 TRINITY_DN24114_c0_g1_i1:107-925(+)